FLRMGHLVGWILIGNERLLSRTCTAAGHGSSVSSFFRDRDLSQPWVSVNRTVALSLPKALPGSSRRRSPGVGGGTAKMRRLSTHLPGKIVPLVGCPGGCQPASTDLAGIGLPAPSVSRGAADASGPPQP